MHNIRWFCEKNGTLKFWVAGFFLAVGWNCFQMGLGRKIDPEPGRCRRTDGKKWRCSKEAFLDSKYCERHMHRGKNRSRKPVEVLKTSPISTPKSSDTTTITTKINTCSASPSPAAFHSLSSSLPSLSSSDSHPYPFLYHHHSSSSRPPGIGFPHQERNTTSLFLDSGSYPQPSSEYRFVPNTKLCYLFSCICFKHFREVKGGVFVLAAYPALMPVG